MAAEPSAGDSVAALAGVIQAAATQHEQAKSAAVDGGVGPACVRLLQGRELSAAALIALANMLRVFCKADDARPVASRYGNPAELAVQRHMHMHTW